MTVSSTVPGASPTDAPNPEACASGPLWLSHHHNGQRCVQIRGRAFCRRCLALYPTVVLTFILAATVPGARGPLAVAAVWLLLTPMVIEWVLEHASRIEYSPRRQVIVSTLAGIGGGIALSIHARDPFNRHAGVPVLAAGIACLGSAWLSATSGRRSETEPQDDGWLERHESVEAERLDRLTDLLALEHPSSEGGSGVG